MLRSGLCTSPRASDASACSMTSMHSRIVRSCSTSCSFRISILLMAARPDARCPSKTPADTRRRTPPPRRRESSTAPTRPWRDDGLAGANVDRAVARGDAQRAAQDDGVFVELGRLSRLDPSARTVHPRHTARGRLRVDASDELFDSLRFVTRRFDDGRLFDVRRHARRSSLPEHSFHAEARGRGEAQNQPPRVLLRASAAPRELLCEPAAAADARTEAPRRPQPAVRSRRSRVSVPRSRSRRGRCRLPSTPRLPRVRGSLFAP